MPDLEIVQQLRAQCNCNIDTSPCGAEEDCHRDKRAANIIEAAHEALVAIRRYAGGDVGSRTFDDCMRNLMFVDDYARAALAKMEGRDDG